jgi:hypothetical protein
MAYFQPTIRNHGSTWFVVRSPDGRVHQAFTTLGELLRRRLYSSLPNGKIENYAVMHDWTLLELQRRSQNIRGFPQVFRLIVTVHRPALGKVRLFSRINNLIQLLEQITGYPLDIHLHVYKTQDGKLVLDARHISGSAAFARLFLHKYTFASS